MCRMRLSYRSLFALALVLPCGCATTGPVTADRIRADMASVVKSIRANRGTIDRLNDRRVGKTGFYYIVDTNGRVVAHPQKALIGSSFRDHWFVNTIIDRGTGCISYRLGSRTHLVFFNRLDDWEILCFSILADDLTQPADCPQVEMP
ncbi:MAG: Cache 3/Cache 2 fusion domain-containing protein [Spirochaetes bacterium]|nr:Cache 3/Cache 2 fusion domain-containing protein [Spirochaetota bacterium]